MNDKTSLLTASMDVCDVVIKTQFIVYSDAQVPESVNNLYWLVVYRAGAVRGGEFTACVQDEFLCLGDIEEKVTV